MGVDWGVARRLEIAIGNVGGDVVVTLSEKDGTAGGAVLTLRPDEVLAFVRGLIAEVEKAGQNVTPAKSRNS